MNKSSPRLLFLGSLILVGAAGCAHDATTERHDNVLGPAANVIELYDHIAGPAAHVHSLRLMQDGSVMFEEYNITGEKDRASNGTSILCRMPPSSVASATQNAMAATAELLPLVPGGGPVMLDGPFRTITIREGNHELHYTLDGPESAHSQDAERFLDAWRMLERQLSCQGPNYSFKADPLRGSPQFRR